MGSKHLDRLEADPEDTVYITSPTWDQMASIIRAVGSAIDAGAINTGCDACTDTAHCDNCQRISWIISCYRRFEEDE